MLRAVRRGERIEGFVRTIWLWYAKNKRSLPWRDLAVADSAERAYRVLVSEIMLQQTHVARVKVIYPRFLKEFPTLHALAAASNRQVILAWRGMGYNSRALRLRDAALWIVEKFQVCRLQVSGSCMRSMRAGRKNLETCKHAICNFPRTMEELTAIPGIGNYTAAAILNFAFNIPTPCIDTNIRRILHRTFVGPERPDGTWRKDDLYLLRLAREVLEAAVEPVSPPLIPSFHPCLLHRTSIPWPLPPPAPVASLRCGAGEEEGEMLIVNRFPLSSGEGARGRGSVNKVRRGMGGEAFPRDARNWHAALMDFGALVQTKQHPKWDQCPLTIHGLMKATIRNFPKAKVRSPRSEPGRRIAGHFVPDRIVRGRIVDTLRSAPSGLALDALGRRVASDWSLRRHEAWLLAVLRGLKRDRLITVRRRRCALAE